MLGWKWAHKLQLPQLWVGVFSCTSKIPWATCLMTAVPVQARPSCLCQVCLGRVLPSQDADPCHLVWGYRAINTPQGAWERVSFSRPAAMWALHESHSCNSCCAPQHRSRSHCCSRSHRSLPFSLPADLTFPCCRQCQQLLLEPAWALQSAGRINRGCTNCQAGPQSEHVKHPIHNNAYDTSKISPWKSHPACCEDTPKHPGHLRFYLCC